MFSAKSLMLFVVLLLSLSVPSEAFFRLLCFNPLGFARVDPIVSPGEPSMHLHHLHGSGNLGINSVNASYLLDANCTSCSVTSDKSAYWAPAMYFHHDDGTFELLNTSGSITIYYKTEKRVNFLDQNYTVFPTGFRMIAGDNARRNWVGPWPVPEQSLWTANDLTQGALSSKALGFNCLNYKRGWDEATFAFPYMREKSYIDANCLDGVRAEVLFPSCWDGVNLDSPDHKSHVAYPTLLQDGACPKTHPVYLPILFYETIWNTHDFVGVPGQFVFSNGDPTGYGYHADFLAAWETGVLEQVTRDPNCTDQDIFNRHVDGIQEHCPVLAPLIQPQDEAAQCQLKMPQKLVKEKVISPLNVLPGSIQITGRRHDPGTDPEDGALAYPSGRASSSMSLSASAVNSTSVQAPSATFIAPDKPPFRNSTVTASATAANATAVNSVNSTAITSAVVNGTTSVPASCNVSTTVFVSNGVWYEIDVVRTLVTETSIVYAHVTAVNVTTTTITMTAQTTTMTVTDQNATVTMSKRHVHGQHGNDRAVLRIA